MEFKNVHYLSHCGVRAIIKYTYTTCIFWMHTLYYTLLFDPNKTWLWSKQIIVCVYVCESIFFFKTLYNLQENCVLHVIVKNKELYIFGILTHCCPREGSSRYYRILTMYLHVLQENGPTGESLSHLLLSIIIWLFQTMAYT